MGLIYFFQEKLIFFPEKLDKDFRFSFDQDFEELHFKTGDSILLHGLLFRSQNSKGLIFYLHGNAGSVSSWGGVAQTYTDLNYDVFILDYRGFGKSEGKISSEEQLFQDVQTVYNELKKSHDDSKIIVLGYSIGTGLAANIAATNKPKMLILQAPYFSLVDIMKKTYPILPAFILKYKLETNKFIARCTMPIVLFHGKEDEIIPFNSSLKLKEIIKLTDTLITLDGGGHNGMTDNPEYKREIKRILSR